MTKNEPTKEHQWLLRMAGEWTCEGEAIMEPGKPPTTWSSSETVRTVGSMWVVGESESDMPGCGVSTSVITLGYDPQKGRFCGTFYNSMMPNLWVYDGKLEGDVLTLDTEGPDMSPEGGTAKYQDIVELKSDDERLLKSRKLNADGTWAEFMTMTFRRKK
jgi:hypothetical protein